MVVFLRLSGVTKPVNPVNRIGLNPDPQLTEDPVRFRREVPVGHVIHAATHKLSMKQSYRYCVSKKF